MLRLLTGAIVFLGTPLVCCNGSTLIRRDHPMGVGDRFVDIGKFRLADIDGNHFSIGHKESKKIAVILRGDGTIHPGPRTDFGAFDRKQIGRNDPIKGVMFGDRFIDIGNFRIADIDGVHSSFSHKITKKTIQIFRDYDGTIHPGPRTDFVAFNRPTGDPKQVWFGEKVIAIGALRIADIDGWHLSLFFPKTKKTAHIYRGDGTIHKGERTDFQVADTKPEYKVVKPKLLEIEEQDPQDKVATLQVTADGGTLALQGQVEQNQMQTGNSSKLS